MANSNTLQLQYNKALRYYLLTKYSHAATTCVKAFDQLSTTEKQDDYDALQLQLWLLYINIAAASLPTSTTGLTPRLAKQFGLPSTSTDSIEHFCLAIWGRLVISCGENIAGNCDPRLVCAYLSMTLKQSIPTVGRQVAEQWFATLPETTIDHLSSVQEQTNNIDGDGNLLWVSYLQMVDLYATRILPETGDFESARSFVEYNSFLSDEKKETLMNFIQHTEDDQQREIERKKRLEQQKKEEAEAAAKQAILEKQRQEQNAREIHQRKKREAALQQQKQQQQKQQQQQQQQLNERSISSPSSSTRVQPVAQQRSTKSVSDQSLIMVKTWIQQLRATGSAASVAILVVFFAILGLLKGPRGYLTGALKSIMEKLWQTAKMGTKVTYM
ncbi:hypothetical protein BCR42DRAFT_450867 [Absidia repens]|uniref:Uncharacterized protein n=1 Tax=Absidia repens TaxID=90262 RepID=A0A1X2II89_9FUNG|nr:hypothetical protein BCR42DRAFT_450867 [Absidia repens]